METNNTDKIINLRLEVDNLKKSFALIKIELTNKGKEIENHARNINNLDNQKKQVDVLKENQKELIDTILSKNSVIDVIRKEQPAEYEDIATKVGKIRKTLDEKLDKMDNIPEIIDKAYKEPNKQYKEAKKYGKAKK